MTLEELSGQYDVSRERIRQSEVRAFEKLQARMQELAKEREAARELYVALTRARDRLIIVMPRERTKARDNAERMVDLLRDRAGFDTAAEALTVAGQAFAARALGFFAHIYLLRM